MVEIHSISAPILQGSRQGITRVYPGTAEGRGVLMGLWVERLVGKG